MRLYYVGPPSCKVRCHKTSLAFGALSVIHHTGMPWPAKWAMVGTTMVAD